MVLIYVYVWGDVPATIIVVKGKEMQIKLSQDHMELNFVMWSAETYHSYGSNYNS